MIKSYEFWIAVGVALIVKIKTSKSLGPWAVLTTIAVAVGAAWVGTEWVVAVAGIPEPVAAALVAAATTITVNSATAASGDNRTMILGAATRVLFGAKELQLEYNHGLNAWYEVGFFE